jgi:hypothetical protein
MPNPSLNPALYAPLGQVNPLASHPKQRPWRRTTQFAFQPVYNQSSFTPQSHREQSPQEAKSSEATDGEVEISLDRDPVEEAVEKDPEFKSQVCPKALHEAPNIFQIDLETYPLCPWKRLDPRTVHPQQYRQWFNYNLTPKTWTKYSESQKRVQVRLKELLQ